MASQMYTHSVDMQIPGNLKQIITWVYWQLSSGRPQAALAFFETALETDADTGGALGELH